MNNQPRPKTYQPRFFSYAKSQGLTPDQTLERDQRLYPGGVMCGFILWMNENIHKYLARKNEPRIFDQQDFTRFVDTEADTQFQNLPSAFTLAPR